MHAPATGRSSFGRGVLILVPFALYPSVDFIFRISNAAQLGFISSVFFIAFGLSQVPLGLALDRFGPRNATLFLLATGIAGVLIFAGAENQLELIAGRVLLGIGMSASLIAGIKATTLWLPGRLPFTTLILVGSTGVGGMIATVPFAEVLKAHSWQDALLVLASVTVLLFIAIALLTPGGGGDRSVPVFRQFTGYGVVLRSRVLWRFAPIAMAGVGAGPTMAARRGAIHSV